MEEILIWESNVERLRACELAVYHALKAVGLKALVTSNSEPPLISRNQLWERLPVLEINGLRWSLRPGEPFTAEQLTRLFSQVFAEQLAAAADASVEGQTPVAKPDVEGETDAR